jgi:hypothetical protein
MTQPHGHSENKQPGTRAPVCLLGHLQPTGHSIDVLARVLGQSTTGCLWTTVSLWYRIIFGQSNEDQSGVGFLDTIRT